MRGLPSALQRALALQELRGRSEVLCGSNEQPKSTDTSEDGTGEVAILQRLTQLTGANRTVWRGLEA